jgi:ABC-type protease/lipase transport system fused ATPase/permease subunit
MDLLLGLLLIFIASVAAYFGVMLKFMGLAFLLLSILKLIDIKGFVKVFKTYDFLAKHIPYYAIIYPFIELTLAICYLFHFFIQTAAVITVIIMLVGSAGILTNLLSKDKVKCACLGARINVPLTRFTLIEDLLMAAMALWILFT